MSSSNKLAQSVGKLKIKSVVMEGVTRQAVVLRAGGELGEMGFFIWERIRN